MAKNKQKPITPLSFLDASRPKSEPIATPTIEAATIPVSRPVTLAATYHPLPKFKSGCPHCK